MIYSVREENISSCRSPLQKGSQAGLKIAISLVSVNDYSLAFVRVSLDIYNKDNLLLLLQLRLLFLHLSYFYFVHTNTITSLSPICRPIHSFIGFGRSSTLRL